MTSTDSPGRWSLTLYVSGASPQSAAAVEAVRKICAEELPGQYDLDVVDVHDAPRQVVADEVLAVPTLVKRLPAPLRRLVGDLGDVDFGLVGKRLTNGLLLGVVLRPDLPGAAAVVSRSKWSVRALENMVALSAGFIGPRFALLLWWIFGDKVDAAFSSWIWPLIIALITCGLPG